MNSFLSVPRVLMCAAVCAAVQVTGFAAASEPALKEPVVSIGDVGAIGDGKAVNTLAIQKAIDQLAAGSGGTVVVPKGVFVSGAIFLKQGVDLHLEKEAVLQCSLEMTNFPEQRTRIEGHFEEHFTPGLINVKGCDGVHITGEGTLDGAGRPVWDQWWTLRRASKDPKNFSNMAIPRARLCVIESSKNVVVEGLTFKDSQFWNLHLYLCDGVVVKAAKFLVPDDYKQAPSTDGIDVDSSRNVTVDGCYFSVTDDCIAMKGSKGPHALEDKESPPVEHVHVMNCTFKRGGSVTTLGSEATVVRDVLVENCQVIGGVNVAVIKLRSDTPQDYEDIHFRNITLDSSVGMLISMAPWTQYIDLKGEALPQSMVKNVTLSDISGRFGALGSVQGNKGQTTIEGVTFSNIDVKVKNSKLKVGEVKGLKFEKVVVNGQAFTGVPGGATTQSATTPSGG